MYTFDETEKLLQSALVLSGNSLKQIATESGIKPNTLYKFNSSKGHLSPTNSDKLMLYFIENEQKVLIAASIHMRVIDFLCDYLTSSSDTGCGEKEE